VAGWGTEVLLQAASISADWVGNSAVRLPATKSAAGWQGNEGREGRGRGGRLVPGTRLRKEAGGAHPAGQGRCHQCSAVVQLITAATATAAQATVRGTHLRWC
jgi:hypothetical protein